MDVLASFRDFGGAQGSFLSLPCADLSGELLQLDSSKMDPKGSLHLRSGGSEDRGVEGPTSSGSGPTGTRGQKQPKECQNAQKRFRARQKERMTHLEREVAEKKAAFEQLAAENELLKARTNILEKVVNCRDEQLSMMQAFEAHCRTTGDSPSCFGNGVSNTMASEPPEAQEAYRKLKKEQVIPQYKAFLAEVSRHLLHCQYPCADPNSPIVQQVATCVERMGRVLKHILLLNSPLMRTLLSLNLETLQPGAAPESHWDDVAASLQLGPQQRADILAVYDMYRNLIAKVYEERKLIMAALGGGVGTLDPSRSSFGSRPELPSEMELTDRLAANMVKEHSARTLLCCFFFGKVLAPTQFAKVAVYSYPYFPDSLGVATALSRQDSQLAGMALLGSGGSGTGSSDGRMLARAPRF
ncbi:hypothetical protein Agub_g15885 [Astrephomene gubernaculifera]|uniref:BZIP domain-containing protein n=1 Tax=Astrephomene gubernaculifera TaxID=47775 RepID=A0AAD3E5A3_9CHLO|nr:hypothetical protein Agub_g15885 [Astrephomene gubernaculifera]